MLSETERRALRQLELNLAMEEPTLAAALRTHRTWTTVPVPRSLERAVYDITIGTALLAALVCVALSSAGSLPAGLVAAGFAALATLARLRRFPRPRQRRR